MTLRQLPSVDRLAGSLPSSVPAMLRVEIARAAVENARTALARGEEIDVASQAVEAANSLLASRPTRVLNATGVLLHTNLGRAPLEARAAEAARAAAVGYSNLEIDLATGARGGRGAYLQRLLTAVTGAEAAMAVANNAAALFLTLMTFASGRSVPVSRGELIEIGGSYRLPELMAASGTHLVEIGTTNRTRLADYRAAIDDSTALLLKVHPSNYRIAGFTEDTSLPELAPLAAETGLALVFDAGSGLIDARTPWLSGPPPAWLADEPGVVQSLEQGADLVLFSGDKLFAGPQAGIITGDAELIGKMRRHPVARALRLDGPTLTAVTFTAERYADGSAAELPFWKMATTGYDELEERSRRVMERSGVAGQVVPGSSTVGAGSVPGSEVPSPVIAIGGETDRRFLAFLSSDPPMVTRREAGTLIVDLRTIDPADDDVVADLLAETCRS